ncbi:xenobiotic compound monooxygenase, DszA family, A subunit [Calothrix sp. NIES-2100]|uniref:NtaA/DmoA family FMN-dependent monooxygenase n=1 Tax=Calothrix sp. NIES-2100 TaxID=1954172 RepID=UPI000B620E63|nr:xenobiotic compound monooxygenase, DszA family, A subunit [Calothrix sp. NIES-2100]
MTRNNKQLRLGAFLHPTGHHIAAWRHPNAQANPLDFRHYKQLAQTAERGKFDMIFLADGVAVRDRNNNPEVLSLNGKLVHFEPLTLLSALSAVTENIGLVATASTTYNEPFHIARKFASLDYLSGGRAGWNVVTSGTEAEAKNFNREQHVEHALRYERAQEFVEVVTKLWDSWEDDAFLRDKDSGIYFEPDKLHVPNHKGKHFSVRGPLTPQQIADQLEEWFLNDGADGFNIMPPYLPDGLKEFVDLVIPELQRRGLFRTEYEGQTLRENLGLPRPVNQFSKITNSPELAGISV